MLSAILPRGRQRRAIRSRFRAADRVRLADDLDTSRSLLAGLALGAPLWLIVGAIWYAVVKGSL